MATIADSDDLGRHHGIHDPNEVAAQSETDTSSPAEPGVLQPTEKTALDAEAETKEDQGPPRTVTGLKVRSPIILTGIGQHRTKLTGL